MDYYCLIQANKILPFDSQKGVDFFESYPEIVDIAAAMIDCNYRELVFYYHHHKKLLAIRLIWDSGENLVQAMANDSKPAFGLTLRELQIITLLSAGLSDNDIGKQLFISHRTVSKHLQNIFEKIGLDSRTALVSLANLHGLYALPTPISQQSYLALPVLDVQQSITPNRSHSYNFPKQPKSKLAPLRIGIPFVQNGFGSIDANSQIKGAKLAVQHINEKGKLGREIELVFAPFESGDKASISVAYRELLSQEIDAVSASYACYSPDIHELMATKGLPYLHTATSHQAVEYANAHKMSNVFQLCASDVNYHFGIIRLIKDYGTLWRHKRLIVINPSGHTVDIGINKLERELAKLGWNLQVLTSENWQKTVATLQKIDADMMVLASFFAEHMLEFYQEFIKNPCRMLIYGIYAPSVLQGVCEGVIWATTNGLSEHNRVFYKTYQNSYNEIPSQSGASLAYDGIQILANAWQTSPYAKRFEKVNDVLRNTIIHGINGSYYLGGRQVGLAYPDDTADLSISQAHLIFQIQQGQQRLISPSPFGYQKLCLPSWFHR